MTFDPLHQQLTSQTGCASTHPVLLLQLHHLHQWQQRL
jgi:hypothetical protein